MHRGRGEAVKRVCSRPSLWRGGANSRQTLGALALALCLALPSMAQDAKPLDAPVAVVKAGELVPFDGLLLSDTQAIQQAQRVVGAEARAAALEAGVRNSPPWWVVPVVALVALGAGVGIGIAATR